MCARARLSGCSELFIPPPCSFVGVTLSHLSTPREEKRRFLRLALDCCQAVQGVVATSVFLIFIYIFVFYSEEFK